MRFVRTTAGRASTTRSTKPNCAAGRRIRCPVLALWAGRDELGEWFDVIDSWRGWADDVTGHAVDAGPIWPRKQQPRSLEC